MGNWALQNLVSIISLIVSTFIAYHVYFLSKKLNLQDHLKHRDSIKKQVIPILAEMNQKKRNYKVELVNVKKYFSHYPNINEENGYGYTYLAAELKSLKFDGIEFFCGMKELYKNSEDNFSLKEKEGFQRQSYNAFEVGIIPYKWIDYIDANGDEFSYRSQFFTRFLGQDKSPYKYVTYYIENENYSKNDPPDFKYQPIEIDI